MSAFRILIAAGPTREPLDPVRFLSNRSSGKMGYALAEAATAQGHRVTLVSGPVSLQAPRGCKVEFVETASEMRAAVLKHARRADVVVMAAAVADYRPVAAARHKIKKNEKAFTLRLKRTPDILAELGRRAGPRPWLVGFAAETTRLLTHARQKLKSKNLDLILANRVGTRRAGFESDFNQITILHRDGAIRRFPCMGKGRLARKLIPWILPKSPSPLL